MKRSARILSLALAALLALALPACGQESFESAMARAISAMQEVTSQHTDMIMSVDMTLTAAGESVEMPISTSVSMDSVNEPLAAHAVMDTVAMGQPSRMEYYVEQSGESYAAYMSTDAVNWTAMSLDAGGLGQLSAAEGLEFYLRCASAFEKAGEEEVRGAAASRYDGEIPADMMAEALERSGAYSMFEMLGIDSGSAPQLTSGMGLSIWLDDETGLPVAYEIDMAALMDELMEKAFAAVDMELDVAIDEAYVYVTLSDFNGIDAIEIPDEARGA